MYLPPFPINLTNSEPVLIKPTNRHQRVIDADKIKTLKDVRLLIKAMEMTVQPHAPMYSELERLFKDQEI
jgi:hypothetical protein